MSALASALAICMLPGGAAMVTVQVP